MANRRMVSKSISVSSQVNQLDLLGRLLFTWMIPHADDFGRMYADPQVIKALVIPMMDGVTAAEVQQRLVSMHNLGLVILYKVDKKAYLLFPGWETHQSNLSRRTKSKIPDPPADSLNFTEIHGNSELTEPNLTEPNPTKPKPVVTEVYGLDALANQQDLGESSNESPGLSDEINAVLMHWVKITSNQPYTPAFKNLGKGEAFAKMKELRQALTPICDHFAPAMLTNDMDKQWADSGHSIKFMNFFIEKWTRDMKDNQTHGHPLGFNERWKAERKGGGQLVGANRR